MGNVIEEIHQDHINMANLLDVIDVEIDKLVQGEFLDFLMLEHAMRYLISYPDKVHHCKEDVMFRRLAERDEKANVIVNELLREHEQLISKGAQFYEIIRAAEQSEVVRRDEVIAKGKDYVETLRAHMDLEEGDLLKRARKVLSEKDLVEIDAAVDSDHDPLFGQTVQKEYEDLYKYIMVTSDSGRHEAIK